MFDHKPETPETVQFNSDCLLSKWGFGDGDMLDWLYAHNEQYDPHATLIECVERKLLPALKQKVELRVIMCIHNPCRAGTVDGVDVSGLWYDSSRKLDEPLSPEWIVMSGVEILEIAEEIRLNSENAKGMARGLAAQDSATTTEIDG